MARQDPHRWRLRPSGHARCRVSTVGSNRPAVTQPRMSQGAANIVLVAPNGRVQSAVAQLSGPLLDAGRRPLPRVRADKPREPANCLHALLARGGGQQPAYLLASHPVSIPANMASAGSRCRTRRGPASTRCAAPAISTTRTAAVAPFTRRAKAYLDEKNTKWTPR